MLLDLLAELGDLHPEWRRVLVAPAPGPLTERAARTGAGVRVLGLPASLAALGDAGASVRGRGGWRLAGRLAAAAPAARRYRAALRRQLAEVRPDVVHTNGLKMHLLGAYAAARETPVAWHLHDFAAGRRAASLLLRAAAGRAAAGIAVSAAVAADAERLTGGRLPVRTIPNGVDLARFRPQGTRLDLDALAGLPPPAVGTVRVGLVATLGLWKGHEVFLRALAALPGAPSVRGYVVGGGIYRTAGSEVSLDGLRRLAAELGISARVGFTGFVDDAAAAMRALDVVVHASTEPEPFGLAIAEAMACGRAVVASAAGGAAEIVAPEGDALAVPPGDVAALAAAIRRLAADGELRGRLGAAARATALARFDRARPAAEVAALYRELAPR